mgnify:CR=1 FL=1
MVFLHRATVRGVESGAWLHPLICIHILYPMSSTRNKNTLGNYTAQVRENNTIADYTTNHEKMYAGQTYLAGDGLIQGHMPDNTLSTNPTNIESFLFGIGSNNFIHPQHTFKADLKILKSASIIDTRVPLILPEPLKPLQNQRPFPLP